MGLACFAKQALSAFSLPKAGQAGMGVSSSFTPPALIIKDETGTIYPQNRGIASLAAAVGPISNTETVLISGTLPANSLLAGSTFKVKALGVGTTSTSPGNTTFRIRIGPTTLTGNIPTSVVAAATASLTAQPWRFEGLVTIRTITASGTVIGECVLWANSASGLFPAQTMSATVATVVVDSTVANLIELTVITGASSANVTTHVATIEQVKA